MIRTYMIPMCDFKEKKIGGTNLIWSIDICIKGQSHKGCVLIFTNVENITYVTHLLFSVLLEEISERRHNRSHTRTQISENACKNREFFSEFSQKNNKE